MVRLHFTMVIEGNESIQNSFNSILEKYPNTGNELVNGVASVIVCAFKFPPQDAFQVISFNAGVIAPPKQIDISSEPQKEPQNLVPHSEIVEKLP